MHEHEKKVLIELSKKDNQDYAQLAKSTKLKEDAISFAAATLAEKSLVNIEEQDLQEIKLTKEGKKYLEKGLPEKNALNLLEKKSMPMPDFMKKIEEGNIALVWLKKLQLAEIKQGKVTLTDKGIKALGTELPHKKILKLVNTNSKIPGGMVLELVDASKRKLILIKDKKHRTVTLTKEGQAKIKAGISDEKETSKLTPEMIITGSWKKHKFRPYNVKAPSKEIYPGKKHFSNEAIDYVRKIWLEMGFKEMNGSIIQSSFWNFDALFTPQSHPAREMQDTFFIDAKKIQLPDINLVKKVREAHEIGTKDSIGWNYLWDEEEAKKPVLRTHTTCLSADTLAKLKKEDWPAKYFGLGRVFRNETLDWSHLFEFNQVEGIVVDEHANFKHLLGYLKEFYNKMGFKNVRVRPAYFPYTEMSLEVEVYHPLKRQYIELGGAGIFRPEVVEPLLGEDIPVLAWGQGFGRIIMDYYKLDDIREKYKNDIQRLRTSPKWMI